MTDACTYDAFGILLEQYVHDGYGRYIPPTWEGAPAPALKNHLYAGEYYDPDLGMYYNRARYYNPQLGRFWTSDAWEGNNAEPVSLHKYLYAHANPVNGTDPSGHEFTILGLGVASGFQHGGRTSEGAAIAAFQARALQTLTFKIEAWAIVSASAATTIGIITVAVAASTDDEEVNQEIAAQIEQAKRQGKKLRFFHYSPRTYEERGTSMFPGSFAALRGNMYYYEARAALGVGDPKYVYPVVVDPLVDLVVPRGLVPSGGYGFGGEPQVEFPNGTQPGTVLPGKLTPK